MSDKFWKGREVWELREKDGLEMRTLGVLIRPLDMREFGYIVRCGLCDIELFSQKTQIDAAEHLRAHLAECPCRGIADEK